MLPAELEVPLRARRARSDSRHVTRTTYCRRDGEEMTPTDRERWQQLRRSSENIPLDRQRAFRDVPGFVLLGWILWNGCTLSSLGSCFAAPPQLSKNALRRRQSSRELAEVTGHNQAIRALGRHLVRVIWAMLQDVWGPRDPRELVSHSLPLHEGCLDLGSLCPGMFCIAVLFVYASCCLLDISSFIERYT